MLYQRLTLLGLVAAMGMPAAVMAQGTNYPATHSTSAFSYTYGEVNVDYIDPDHGADDSGLNLQGSAELIPHGFVTAGYTNHDYGRLDSDLFSIGLGWHVAVQQMPMPTDLVISGAFNHNKFNRISDDNYGTLEVGFRSRLTDQLEVNGGVEAFLAEDTFNRDVGAKIGVRFYPVHQISLGLNAEVTDNTVGFKFGGRYEF